jgi:hypothetical protein
MSEQKNLSSNNNASSWLALQNITSSSRGRSFKTQRAYKIPSSMYVRGADLVKLRNLLKSLLLRGADLLKF